MTFGWQSFQVDHPDDWAPTSLRGSAHEGYARIASPGRIALQVRWNDGRPADLRSALDSYLSRLRKESLRRRKPFRADTRTEDGRLCYHWIGDGQGRGSIFCVDETVYFLEVTGAGGDSLLPRLKSSLATFRKPAGDVVLWSVLGLCLWLPRTYRLETHAFQAGKTELDFAGRVGSLQCIRWGFAEQLLERYSLEGWARSALGMAAARSQPDAGGVRLEMSNALSKKVALVRLQEEHNQIITVKASFRNENGRPAWAWFEEAPTA